MSDDKRERLGEILGQVLGPIQEKLNTLETYLISIDELKQQINQVQAEQAKIFNLLKDLSEAQSSQPTAKSQAKTTIHDDRKSTEQVKQAVAPQLWSFVEEHAELLQVLDQAIQAFDAKVYATVEGMVADELNKHFRYEEEILFPTLGKYIGTTAGPIVVMLQEHKIIRDDHEQFRSKLQQFNNGSASESDVIQAYKELDKVLRPHIIKEDNVLFPMASGVMSLEDKDEIARRVQEQNNN